jgi:hypothetical protein
MARLRDHELEFHAECSQLGRLRDHLVRRQYPPRASATKNEWVNAEKGFRKRRTPPFLTQGSSCRDSVALRRTLPLAQVNGGHDKNISTSLAASRWTPNFTYHTLVLPLPDLAALL